MRALPATLPYVSAPAFDGGELQFDGVYYDYRDAQAQKGIKLWVPPGDAPVRGIIFHGNPGGSGDTRPLAMDENLQEFAARHRFAIAGVTWFRGGEVYHQTGAVIAKVLEQWAALGYHPELAHVPLIPRGSSNAGVTAYGLACFMPARIICFTPNVGPRYTPRVPPDAVLRVPALLHIGPTDPFFPLGVKDTAELMCHARARGAVWAWDAEQGKGHEIRHVDDVDLKFYDTCIALRLPAEYDPRSGPVTLVDLPLTNGWLADTDTWHARGGACTHIAPYEHFDRAERPHYVWLPDKDNAILYRAIATYGNPLTISLRDMGPVDNPHAEGQLLRSVGGAVVEPSTRIVVECDASGMPDWERMEFRDGGRVLGQVTRGQKAEWAFTVDGAQRVYALVALGYDSSGTVRTSYPLHFIVRDPEVSAALRAQRAAHAAALRTRPRTWRFDEAPVPAPDAHDAALVAFALTAAQAQQFGAAPGVPAAFWRSGAASGDCALVRVSSHAVTKRPAAHDEMLRVRAAHASAGVYLLFELLDPAPDASAEIDVHLAREASSVLWSGTPRDHFIILLASLACSEAQYHVPFGTPEKPGDTLRRNIPMPWHMAPRLQTLAQARAEDGIIVRHVVVDGRRAQEWFLPWEQVGLPGVCSAPPPGARLGLAIGYNNGAEDDYSSSLRWPGGVDVWTHSYEGGPQPNPWGDLIIGE